MTDRCRPFAKRMLLILFSVVLLGALGLGCGADDAVSVSVVASTEPPTQELSEDPPSIDLTPLPTPVPGAPFVLIINETAGPRLQIHEIVEYFDLIVMGEVVEVLPAQWTTPDGNRPVNPWDTVPGEFTIVTPYVIEPQLPEGLSSGVASRLLPLSDAGSRVPQNAANIVIVAQGGQVGEDRVEYNGVAQSYEVGERVLVAVKDVPGFDPSGESDALVPTPKGPGWWVSVKYAIAGDKATDYAGVVPLEQLVRDIVQAISQKPSAPPLPTPE